MTRALHDRRSLTALAAVALFVVQMLLSSWAMAGMPSGAMVDAFGNPICVTDPEGHPTPSREHGTPSTCCALGCLAFAAFVPAPQDEAILAPLAPAGVPILAWPSSSGPVVRLDHDPGNPRAPPLPL